VKKGVDRTTVEYTFCCWGGGRETTQRASRQPKSGRQTSTRKGRLSADGRVRRQKRHCRLCLLNDTTPHELRCLLNNNVNVQQRLNRVWYAQAHDSAERAVGFVTRKSGGMKGGRTMLRPQKASLRALTSGVWC
jgi:hypothetical protein